MSYQRRLLPLFVLVILMSGCSQSYKAPDGKQLRSNVATVEKWMTGTFESKITGERIVQARIWTFLDDGSWFYSQHSDHPKQTRIFRLQINSNGSVAMDMFAIPGNPLDYPAPWQGNGSMGGLHPESLDSLAGCGIDLRKIDGNEFSGSTLGDGCPSTRDGSAYETMQITLRSNRLALLNRGYDSTGKQVWGSTSGPVSYGHTSQNVPGE